MHEHIQFTLAVLAVLGVPGPTNTLLATAGAALGLRRALPLVPAEAAGYAVSIIALGLAIGPVMAAVPHLATAMHMAVGIYLLVFALRLWSRGGATRSPGGMVTPRELFVATLLNPKALVFALGIVPFGAGLKVWLPYMLAFVPMAISVAVAWIGVGVLMGNAAGRRGWGNVLPRLGAAVIGGFSVLMILRPLLQ